MAPDPPAGWLFVSPEALPDEWRSRSVPAVLVPLLPDELSRMLAGSGLRPTLSADEERLARLVAAGRTGAAIARQLGISRRTVERRMSALRERLGLGSSVNLVSALAARGFTVAHVPTAAVGGGDRAVANTSSTGAPGQDAALVERSAG